MTNRFFAGQTNFIEELNALDGESGDAQQAIDDHIADTTGAHAASAISNTPAGNIAATTVQAAINELDAAKANLAGAAFTGAVSATSFTGPLTGNASTATTLATARNINGVSFNGSADITVTAAAGTLTGNTLAAGVTASSLTSVGTLTALTVSGQASFTDGSAAAPSVKIGDEQNGLYSDGTGSLSFATAGARVVRMGTVGGTGNYLRLDANNTPMVTAVAGATNADIGLASAGTGSVMLATNGGINNLQARVTHTASAVNYWQLTGSGTGSAVWLDVRGSDSNVSALYSTKGTGSHTFASGNSATTQFAVNHTASAVNFIQVTGAGTGAAPSVAVGGTDANVYFNYYTKGTGWHQFITGGGLQAVVGDAVSAVNYWTLTGSATGDRPAFRVQGSDTNIGVYLATKGTGSWRFATGGGDQFRILNAASAVNYFSAYGAATGSGPILYADGADAAMNANYSLKGGGSHVFYTGSTSAVQFVIAHVASTVNWPVISGSATGNAVTISTNGTDANRSISLTAAGTGLVQITNDSLRIVTSKTPASAAATGTQGQIAWDASYIYVCTATDTWKRAALATW